MGLLGLIFLISVWRLLRPLFIHRSQLLQPDRFIIRTDERRHLKGREDELKELADLCERQSLVFLEGESGAGKSALVHAGLLDECERRRRLHPIYVDLSGAGWEDRLQQFVCHEVWLSLSDDDRKLLGLKSPFSPQELFSVFAGFASRLSRTPVLIFDQFDDYQSNYPQRFRENDQASTWIGHEALTRVNLFWREIARLVERGAIHCLFVSRTDNAAGFDAVRFVPARTYRLPRVHCSLIAPLLHEITVPETASRPVVAYPEAGWEALKERLLADLTEDDAVLPVQLSLVLQALRRFPVLTVRLYNRHGGALGLERFYIEQNLLETSQVTGVGLEVARKILVSLVDPVKQKAVQLTAAEIAAALAPEGAAIGGLPTAQQVVRVLEYLAGKGVVRHRAGEPGRDDDWLLQHDSLCRGVLAADRQGNRWRALLQEGAIRWRASAGMWQRWRALLSPLEQVRLFFWRLIGKLRYGPEGRFALLSTLRFLPFLLLLLGIWGAAVEYRRLYEDKQEAVRIFTVFASGRQTSGESEQLSTFASASPRVRWRVFDLAFADAKHAELANSLLPMLLRLQLGLDPQGNLRQQLWKHSIRPALKAHQDLKIVNLALVSWKEAPGNEDDAQALARHLGQAMALPADANVNLRYLIFDLPFLAPYLQPASAQSLADSFLEVFPKQKGEAAEALAKSLVVLLPQLRDDQKRRAASSLAAALIKGNNLIIGPLLPFWNCVDPAQFPALAAAVARSKTAGPTYPRTLLTGKKPQYMAKYLDSLQELDDRVSGQITQTICQANDTKTSRLIQAARALTELSPQTASPLRQQFIPKAVDAVAGEPNLFLSATLAASLGGLASGLSPAQANIAIAKLLQALQVLVPQHNLYRLGELAWALGMFKDQLNLEDARRASVLLVAALESQKQVNPSGDDLLFGLQRVAVRLNPEWRAGLLNAVLAVYLKLESSSNQWGVCLKELASLNDSKTVRNSEKNLLKAIEQEKDRRKYWRLYLAAGILADCLEPDLLNALVSHLVRDMEQEENSPRFVWSRNALNNITKKISPELLHRAVQRLMKVSLETQNQDTADSLAETLAGLMDRLEPADAREAAAAIVAAVGKSRKYNLSNILNRMQLPSNVFSEPQARDLSERLARVLDQIAGKESLFLWEVDRYGITRPQAIQNVAALISAAPDQLLLDLLKRPFAQDHMQEVVLRAWELKYGQQFNNDLWRFVAWAANDPRTRNLNFGP